MFTGIIQAKGKLEAIEQTEQDAHWLITTPPGFLNNIQIGSSIAVNGCCLTVTKQEGNSFSVDISAETLSCTVLGQCQQGQLLNLEKALRLSDGLDGHMVSGHVDGVGTLVKRQSVGESFQLHVQFPPQFAPFIATKGSICIDGVSLTINAVDRETFMVNIIPLTAQETTLGDLIEGNRVNLEVDLIARYVARMVETQ